MNAISDDICNTIEARPIAGDTYQVAFRTSGVSLATISRLAKNHKVESHQKRSRKPKIWGHLARLLLKKLLTGRTALLRRLLRSWLLRVQLFTLNQSGLILPAANFKAMNKKPARPLTPARKKNWTAADWRKVAFTDGRAAYAPNFHYPTHTKKKNPLTVHPQPACPFGCFQSHQHFPSLSAVSTIMSMRQTF
ncbi:uncharacterized protein BYT42DRAFT_139165 [Radiomyces spectabilis]|uniref:uncharacterized protein n=1 Tax=Radiomyces spectabilis TaxID=64574 RepID=UPI0022203775|nr:uncharacterized protein BYT42DRAFT_139165 [Radiomyces spectabilis]KAI8366677.1 hypothetical protein BYT42DRAFT_139165 [Radiomyces spectabilis]